MNEVKPKQKESGRSTSYIYLKSNNLESFKINRVRSKEE